MKSSKLNWLCVIFIFVVFVAIEHLSLCLLDSANCHVSGSENMTVVSWIIPGLVFFVFYSVICISFFTILLIALSVAHNNKFKIKAWNYLFSGVILSFFWIIPIWGLTQNQFLVGFTIFLLTLIASIFFVPKDLYINN